MGLYTSIRGADPGYIVRLVNYKCTECGREAEVLYNDTEEQIEVYSCPGTTDEGICMGNCVKYDFKNNSQRWRFHDR
jgi:hypothetical protein